MRIMILATVLLGGCSLVQLDAQVEETCVTYHDLTVDALPAAAGTATFDQSFTVDHLDAFKALADQGFTLAFARAEARATSGIADFSFVDKAKVSVASGDPASTLPTLAVLDCDACATNLPVFEVAVATGDDAAAYVASGSVVVDLALTGRAPTVNWSMDVDVCMTGSLQLSLGK